MKMHVSIYPSTKKQPSVKHKEVFDNILVIVVSRIPPGQEDAGGNGVGCNSQDHLSPILGSNIYSAKVRKWGLMQNLRRRGRSSPGPAVILLGRLSFDHAIKKRQRIIIVFQRGFHPGLNHILFEFDLSFHKLLAIAVTRITFLKVFTSDL